MNATRKVHRPRWSDELESAKELPTFRAPVLAGTLLCLDLLLAQHSINLRACTTLIRRDPGAVLRLYAFIAEECPDPNERPERIEDCIAAVGIHELARVLHARPHLQDQSRLMAFAQHACLIACYAEVVAASLSLCEHRAYTVGLLHAIGTLPITSRANRYTEEALPGAETVAGPIHSHGLSPALAQALDEVHHASPGSVWTAMVSAAHDLAGAGTDFDRLGLPHVWHML